MFNFFRSKSIPTSSIGDVLKTDMHSHLIPGIDDGAPDLKTSIELIKGLKDLGYSKLITTPHTMEGLYSNTTEIITSGLKHLKEELEKEKIDIQVEAASEYFMDMHLEKLIENNDILSFGKERYVLIEMSFAAPSVNYESIIFNLKMKNYTPVLAHPERYSYWHKRPEKFNQITEMGCLLQINLLSLAGYYGKDIKKSAVNFIQNSQASFLGSDVHHHKHLRSLQHQLQESGKLTEGYPFLNSSI
jgi:protein-tyrosine phosphatase